MERNSRQFQLCPPPASIDSISIKYYEESPIREQGYYVSLHKFQTDKSPGYYRWMVWVNDSLLKAPASLPGYFALIDTSKANFPLNLQFPEPFQKGDHLRFKTIKMDKQVYAYYQEMQEMMLNDGGLLGPIPLNPTSNLSGNALGVFQAISIVETEIVIE